MSSRWRMDSSWGRVVVLFADLSINILLFGFKVVDLRC